MASLEDSPDGEELVAPAPTPPKRGPGHRGQDVRDTMAEMAAKAHEISLEAGSRMAGTMREVIGAAAGLTAFAIESARDLVQYMVRRGQMSQDEADKLMRDVEAAHAAAPKPAPKAEPAKAEPAKKAVPVAEVISLEPPVVPRPPKVAAPEQPKATKSAPPPKAAPAVPAAEAVVAAPPAAKHVEKTAAKAPDKSAKSAPIAKAAPAAKVSAKPAAKAPAAKAPAAKAPPAAKKPLAKKK